MQSEEVSLATYIFNLDMILCSAIQYISIPMTWNHTTSTSAVVDNKLYVFVPSPDIYFVDAWAN